MDLLVTQPVNIRTSSLFLPNGHSADIPYANATATAGMVRIEGNHEAGSIIKLQVGDQTTELRNLCILHENADEEEEEEWPPRHLRVSYCNQQQDQGHTYAGVIKARILEVFE